MVVSFACTITYAVAVSLFFSFLFLTVSLFAIFVAVSLFLISATVSFFQNFISSAAVSLLFDSSLIDRISAES